MSQHSSNETLSDRIVVAQRRRAAARVSLFCANVLLAVVAAGCEEPWGKPRYEDRPLRPSEVVDFDTLFQTHCAGCHGGMKAAGGQAPYAVTDPLTGEVTAVNWYAPALNTVFYRYSKEEVRFILNYGRPFSPMSEWGAPGGGPMTEQQIETLLVYLEKIQIAPEGCLTEQSFVKDSDPYVCEGGTLPQANKDEIQKAVDSYLKANPGASEGEALFNSDLASGAYSCARCHTQGWSYGNPGVTGQGGMGWNLTGGSTAAHFPNEADMISFIKAGSVFGKKYGQQGQGSGRMPGFCGLLSDEQIKALVARGAVLGVALDAIMLVTNWTWQKSRPQDFDLRIEKICERAGRDISSAEWSLYFENELYRSTCQR